MPCSRSNQHLAWTGVLLIHRARIRRYVADRSAVLEALRHGREIPENVHRFMSGQLARARVEWEILRRGNVTSPTRVVQDNATETVPDGAP